MELIAQKRESFGKKVEGLRNNRQLPAVMFGKGLESTPLTLDYVSFVKVYGDAGETSLVDLMIDGTRERVLVKDVQLDPITLNPIHVGFHKVNLKEKISAAIPVEVVGEEENELVKSGEALVLTLLNEITVEALPTDFPSEFTVDVSGLKEVGDGITIAQLEYDREKVEITDYDSDEIVVKLDYAQMQETEEVTEEEALAQVEASEELSAEEKAAREAEEKEE
jgi:large subunit ribosomal protein L25